MTKLEFLAELRKRLSGLPKDDLDNRINFYSEMIDDRIDEGKSELEAIEDIGSVDEIVEQITKETPLSNLVKERVSPKRRLKAWEIVLIVLGFPVWFPLLVAAAAIIFSFYVVIWALVIVCYSIELSSAVASVGGFIVFFISLGSGDAKFSILGFAVAMAGLAAVMIPACVYATKGTINLTKLIAHKIKMRFIQKGASK